MASAGLLKLLHSGLQDERLLAAQPSIEPFTTAFLHGGRFTTEWYRIEFDNAVAFGNVAKATLPRRGHLITRLYLVSTMPDIWTAQKAARDWCSQNGKSFAGPTFGWTNSIGHALIQQTQLLIAGSSVDILDGRLMEVLDEFHTPLEKVPVVNRLLGRYDTGFSPRSNGCEATPQTVATPLPFWFARGDPAAALPIDAIGTDSVQVQVTIAPFQTTYVSSASFSQLDKKPYAAETGSNINGIDSVTYPSMDACPFYYLDPDGTDVYGLHGNPDVAVKVSKVPNCTMPTTPNRIPDCSLLAEYVYLDKPEANRIRLGDLTYPIVQHYAISPVLTNHQTSARMNLRIPNPTREFYCMVHRTDADALNAPFLGTRDLSGLFVADISGVGPVAPWWPDAKGLGSVLFEPLIPAYSEIDSEPITSLSLIYEGKLVRYSTDSPCFFRSILPSFEQIKTPWHHKYYYHIPFGTQHERTGITNPMGHANLDKIHAIEISMNFKPYRGSLRSTDVPAYTIYVWAETYTVFRVYGGRAGLLFGY